MANTNVDTEALEQTAVALSVYIDEVSRSIQKMRDAATDCHDNMRSDIYSKNAIFKLETCIVDLHKTLRVAQDIKDRILAKKRIIEETSDFLNRGE